MSNFTNIGFIGLGIMGQSMAKHLLNAGYQLHIYNRSLDKTTQLAALGAKVHENVDSLANECELIITMVAYPYDVKEVYYGNNKFQGILNSAKANCLLIDMTTSSPGLAQEIYHDSKSKSLMFLDAPVSGGDIGAREAKLSIMVGGDEEAFNLAWPIFEKLGTNIVLQGVAGSGQHAKMCNQIVIASTIIGVCESLAYAKRANLDPMQVLKSIGSGAAGGFQLNNLGPRIINGDFAPGFYIEHFLKDVAIALEECKRMDITLPGLQLAEKLFKELADLGYSRHGTQALFNYYIR